MADGQSLFIGKDNSSTKDTILSQGAVPPNSVALVVSTDGGRAAISGSAGPVGILGGGGIGGNGILGSTGVDGPLTMPAGVAGTSGDDRGVHGISSAIDGTGVLGTLGVNSNSAPQTLPAGVAGTSLDSLGVHGISNSAAGVRGDSQTSVGVLECRALP
jgi:hypothetical protein